MWSRAASPIPNIREYIYVYHKPAYRYSTTGNPVHTEHSARQNTVGLLCRHPILDLILIHGTRWQIWLQRLFHDFVIRNVLPKNQTMSLQCPQIAIRGTVIWYMMNTIWNFVWHYQQIYFKLCPWIFHLTNNIYTRYKRNSVNEKNKKYLININYFALNSTEHTAETFDCYLSTNEIFANLSNNAYIAIVNWMSNKCISDTNRTRYLVMVEYISHLI